MRGTAPMKGNVMKFGPLRDQLLFIGLAIGAMAITVAARDVAQAETVTEPDRDIAVITIPNPKEGNLLMLRGLAGRGTAAFRINSTCRTMSVRFVAGDFSGEHISVGRTGPIRIVITNPLVVRDLLAGRELVSDMVRVSSEATDQAADMYLAQGLSADTGFVINPGRNLVADMFGARKKDIDCAGLSAHRS